MQGSILVDIGSDGEFVSIRTYGKEHGQHGRFMLTWSLLLMVLMGTERRSHYDMDCGNWAELWNENEHLWIRFTWLNEYYNGRVQGFKQTIRIPKALILSMLDGKHRRKYLDRPERSTAKIDATSATGTIRAILRNKHTRRAFIKAMRDCFQWPGDEVKLYNDGVYSFYFTTRSGLPKCGGLILHDGTRGGYPCLYYSVHT